MLTEDQLIAMAKKIAIQLTEIDGCDGADLLTILTIAVSATLNALSAVSCNGNEYKFNELYQKGVDATIEFLEGDNRFNDMVHNKKSNDPFSIEF